MEMLADCISRLNCMRRSRNKVVPSQDGCTDCQVQHIDTKCHGNQLTRNSCKTSPSKSEKSKFSRNKTHARMSKLCHRLSKNNKRRSLSSTYQNLSVFNNCDYPFNSSELDNISCSDSINSDWSLYTLRGEGHAMNITVADFNITEEARASTPTTVCTNSDDTSSIEKYKYSKTIFRKMKSFKHNTNPSTLAVL